MPGRNITQSLFSRNISSRFLPFPTLLEKSKIVSLAICALPPPALAEVKALVTKDHSFWPGLFHLKMCLMQAIEHSFRLVLMCVAVLSYLLSTRNLFPQSVCCYMVFAMVSERNIYFPERVRVSVSRIAAGSVTCLRPVPIERVYNIRKATTRES